MMRSLYSGVAGLNTHQKKMDVIGNNIANVNTVGFKSSMVTFSDIMYQTSQSASGANGLTGRGGINPKQTGLGVSTSAVKMSIEGSGAAQTTGYGLDIMLNNMNSTNFFIVNTGSENVFTRDGSFYIDGSGNLCMASTGYTVMGWQVDPQTGDIRKDNVSALRVMQASNLTCDPESTTMATCSGIVDKNSTDVMSDSGQAMNLIVYDSLGYSYTCKFEIHSTAALAEEGTYVVSLTDVLDSTGKSIISDANKQGVLNSLWGPGNANNFTLKFDPDNGHFEYIGAEGNNTQMLRLSELGGNFSNVEVDFSRAITSDNGGTSTIGMKRGSVADGTTGAGKKLGVMTGLSIEENGRIFGTYDNGNTILLGQIAVARFPNASGLEALGNNCFKTTLNSGDFDGIGTDVSSDGGSMTAGALEMSNVDLSTEFTQMITTQRGFQANSRIITTSDTMLEELLNLKR